MTLHFDPAVSSPAVSEQHEWLRLGAIEKARSVVQLTEGLQIRSVLEIGAGTGVILENLDRWGYAESYFAVEPSAPLYAYLQKHAKITRLEQTENALLSGSQLARRRYDLAILSHVIEHVPEPARLLQEAMDVADYVVVEVPLEATILGNLRAELRRRFTDRARNDTSTGHIQFFSRGSLESLIRWSGGKVLRTRLYVPLSQMDHARSHGSLPRRLYAHFVWFGPRLLGKRLWGRVYYGHYAVLVRKLNDSDTDIRTDAQPLYHANEPSAVHM